MEKIYMENNNRNQNQNFFQKLMNSNKSVVLSFVIAILGMASLVAFGFNQTSYAILEIESPLPDQFVANASDSNDKVIGDSSKLPVFRYYTAGDNPIQVYCLEADIGFGDGATYSKGDVINDAGLLYLLANLYPYVPLKMNGQSLDAKTQTWISQTVIWIYLAETGAANQTKITPDMIAKIKSEQALYDDSFSTTGQYLIQSNQPFYDVVLSNSLSINQLLSEALKLKGGLANNLSVNKASDTISMTDDNKYYQTDVVSVIGSVTPASIGNFNGYSIDLSRAPKGTYVTTPEGNKIEDIENMSAGSQFRVYIPVDKVTEENKNIQINILGSFNSYTGNKYIATKGDGSPAQTITSVKTVPNNVSQPLEISLNYTPNVPDTGMSTAQSIYFIGLIVLLSGVGIIYANTKSTQQN